MNYYFDTSSLVKIYHRESGTQNALNIYKNTENKIMISELSSLEFLSAIHRKYRESEFNHDTLQLLKSKFKEDILSRYEILTFSSLVMEEAERLLQVYANQYSLKTLDSIQFAFYMIYCEKEAVFVCSDVKFLNLVKKEGFEVLNL